VTQDFLVKGNPASDRRQKVELIFPTVQLAKIPLYFPEIFSTLEVLSSRYQRVNVILLTCC
jgi:hypothetical protein